MKFLIMTAEAKAANDLFRALGRQVRYPWAYRKLQSARLHMLHSATVEIDEDDCTRNTVLVTNGDVMTENTAHEVSR